MLKLLFPITITAKINECRDFYTTHFGFNVMFENGWYVHLQQKTENATGNGVVELAFMLPNQDSQPPELQAPYTGQGVVYSLEVSDAKAEYYRLKSAGVQFALEYKEELQWGQRHFILTDPAGVNIDVVEMIAMG